MIRLERTTPGFDEITLQAITLAVLILIPPQVEQLQTLEEDWSLTIEDDKLLIPDNWGGLLGAQCRV